MKGRRAGYQGGMGLLEVVIGAILIAILIVVFLSRVVQLSVAVERTAFQQTLNALNAALRIRWLTLLVRHDEAGMARLAGENPMRLLEEPPAGYLGELTRVNPSKIPPRHWYYDLDRHLLVYRVANPDAVEGGARQPRRLRFRVAFKGKQPGRSVGVGLLPLEPYHWKNEE